MAADAWARSDALVVAGDIAEPTTADKIISHAVGRFGRVGTLINNAGLFHCRSDTADTPAGIQTGEPSGLASRRGRVSGGVVRPSRGK